MPAVPNLRMTSPPSSIAFLLLVTGAPVVVVFVLAQRWSGPAASGACSDPWTLGGRRNS